MSIKPETRYTTRLRKKLAAKYPDIDVYKTHNPFTAGIADLYLDGPGGDVWVEMKWASKITANIQPKLTQLQRRFLERREKNGRKILVILGTPEGTLIYNHISDPMVPFIKYYSDTGVVNLLGAICGGLDT